MLDDIKNWREDGSSPPSSPKTGKGNVAVVVTLVVIGVVCIAIFGETLHKYAGRIFESNSRTSTTAYLGIMVQDLTKTMAEAMELKSLSGVVVTNVVRSSPADKAGVRQGDIILQFERELVATVAELERLIAAADPNDTNRIVVDRQGQRRTVYVEMEERPSLLMQTALTSQTDSDDEWGCTISPLNPSLMEQLSIPKAVNGVAVVAIASSGLAKDAGLLAGDVIVSVNREKTPELASFYEAIEKRDTLVLEVFRAGQTLFLTIKARSAAAPLATIAGSVTEGVALPNRVAVAANGTNLDAQLALRFGTAPYFVIADLSTNRFTTIKNDVETDSRGYGIAAGQLVSAQKVGATIARAYGPQAYDALKMLNITPFTAEGGSVVDILRIYTAGGLQMVTEPSLPGYGYARTIMTTGGGSEDDDEEQSGFEGMPYTIPPKGKYDPAADPTNLLQMTAGNPNESDEEDEGGYKGMPTTIPPKGKYDPSENADNPVQPTAGASQRADYCYCPICQKLLPHPPSVSCAELTCPDCGTRLRNVESGSSPTGVSVPIAAPTATNAAAPTADSSQAPAQSQGQARMGGVGATAAPGSILGSIGSIFLNPQAQATLPLPRLALQGPSQAQLGGGGAAATQGSVLGSIGSLYLNQQTEYCYCPICKHLYQKPAGVPCSSLTCTACGSRLVSLNSGTAYMPSAQASVGTTVGGKPDNIPPMGQTSAGVATAGLPSDVPRMGQSSATMATAGPSTIPPGGAPQGGVPAGQSSAGIVVGGKPDTIPPMGQTSAGYAAAGQPAASTSTGQSRATIPAPTTAIIPPGGTQRPGSAMGQSPQRSTTTGQPATAATTTTTTTPTSSEANIVGSGMIPPLGQMSAGTVSTSPSIGVLQGTVDGNCICPRDGTTIPHIRGTACYSIPCPKCGTAMIRDGGGANLLGVAQSVAGDPASAAVTIAGDDSGKICIAAAGPDMDDQVAPMFDRAPYYLLIGLGTRKVVTNPNVEDRSGVAVQSAQLVVSEGATAVITNDISVKALEELSRLRIRVYTGVQGTAAQALDWYQNGRLTPSSLSSNKDDSDHEEEHGSSGGKGREGKASSSSSSKSL